MQNHRHVLNMYGVTSNGSSHINTSGGSGYDWSSTSPRADTIDVGRHGSTTRGKSKGVKFIIKVL